VPSVPCWLAITTQARNGRLRGVNYDTDKALHDDRRPGVQVNSFDVVVDQAAIDKLNRLIEAGPFGAHVAHNFRLDQAVDVHRALDAHYLGKLAMRPS